MSAHLRRRLRCFCFLISDFCHLDGGVAQLGEHLLCKQGVVGSSPITSTLSGIRETGIGTCVATRREEEIAGGSSLGRAAGLLMDNRKEASCVTVAERPRRPEGRFGWFRAKCLLRRRVCSLKVLITDH